ncbi:MAG: hypothetical protein M0026_21465 [Nocardiopsaceae bacterium]|nr:hypothetical protein [Nocardiopsaceae bacterium]
MRAAYSLLSRTSDHLRDADTEEHTALGTALAGLQAQASRPAHELDELIQQERGGDR